MKHGTPDSGPDSGEMCMTESRHLSSSTSERDFLEDRAADARTAIGRKVCDMKETLTKMADVRSCAARHPWILTGSAVVAGVVAGAVLTPSARKRIRRTRKTPPGSAAEAPPARREQEETPRTTKSFLFSIAGTILAAVLQPLLQSWFAPAVAVQGGSPGDPPSSLDSPGVVVSESGVD
jgi:hypothetical protein